MTANNPTFMGVQYSDFSKVHRAVGTHIQSSITQEMLSKNNAGTLNTIDILEFLSFGLIPQEVIDIWRDEVGNSLVHEAISGNRLLKYIESNFRHTLNDYNPDQKRVGGAEFYTSLMGLLKYHAAPNSSTRSNAYAIIFAIAGVYQKHFIDEWRERKEAKEALRLYIAGIPTDDIAAYIDHDIDIHTALAFDEPKRVERQIQVDAYNRLIADIAAQS